MERKIIYLINPVSGTKSKDLLLKALKERTAQQNIPFEIIHTNPAGNYLFLKDKVEKENFTDVVICGGDGTVNQVSGTFVDVDVNIGIIPVGSGNGLALSAKISRNLDKALDIIFTGKASYIDAFFVNSSFSCMLSGLGFDALVAHDFAKQPTRGLSTYVNRSISLFFGASPYYFEIINKGQVFSTEAYFISISNSNQFGNNFTIAPKALLNDGLLDIVIVKKMPKIKMLWSVLRQLKAGKVNDHDEKVFQKKDILYFQTDKLIINNLSLAPLHIDGEPVQTAKKLTVEIVPNAFKLIQP
jgi:diacylglycerol kinase (ATP)